MISTRNEQILSNQVESIDENKLIVLNKYLEGAGLKQEISKDLLRKWTSSIKSDLRKIRRKLRGLDKRQNINFYLMTNYLYSLLIDADKSEVVVGKNIGRKNITLDSSIVNKYKRSKKFKKTHINSLRERAYQEVLNKPVDLKDRIFLLIFLQGSVKHLYLTHLL